MTKWLSLLSFSFVGFVANAQAIQANGGYILDYFVTGVHVQKGSATFTISPSKDSNTSTVKAVLGDSKPWVKLPEDQALLQTIEISQTLGRPITLSVNSEGRVTEAITGNASL